MSQLPESIKILARQRESMIALVVIGLFLTMTFTSEYFFTLPNLLAVLLGLSIKVIVVVGMMNLMVSGGFDLSVGSLVGLTGAVTAITLRSGAPVIVAVLVGIALGVAVGLFNGLIVAKVGVNPFVTTLAGLSLFRGLTYILTRGRNISGLPQSFAAIGQARFLGIQAPIWYVVFLVIVGDILLRHSRFFRQSYYIGGNEEAARLSGINVDRVRIINFVIVSALAALAGIVMTARLGAASTNAGQGLELEVIAATIIGGASLKGGEGTVLGGFVGALLVGLINNALTLFGVDVYWQQFVIGATLLVAVLIDQLGKKGFE
jgi:ribose transport system permease protein